MRTLPPTHSQSTKIYSHAHSLVLTHRALPGGLSWGLPWEAKDLPEPIKGCDGSIVFHPGTQKLYFSHPDPEFDLFRRRLMVWSSSNDGTSWEKHHMVWDNAAGYSVLAVMTDNAGNATLGVLYDRPE